MQNPNEVSQIQKLFRDHKTQSLRCWFLFLFGPIVTVWISRLDWMASQSVSIDPGNSQNQNLISCHRCEHGSGHTLSNVPGIPRRFGSFNIIHTPSGKLLDWSRPSLCPWISSFEPQPFWGSLFRFGGTADDPPPPLFSFDMPMVLKALAKQWAANALHSNSTGRHLALHPDCCQSLTSPAYLEGFLSRATFKLPTGRSVPTAQPAWKTQRPGQCLVAGQRLRCKWGISGAVWGPSESVLPLRC